MRWSSRYFLLLFVLLIPTGCGDDSGPVEPAGNPLDNVTLSTDSASSLGIVRLQGLPSAKDMAPFVVHLLLDEGDPVVIQIDSDAEGPFFRAPFHPAQPNTGGTIELQVTDGSNTGPEMTLDLAALPEAPGAFARVVQALKSHIEQRAEWAGSSFSALQGMAFEAAPPELLSLKIAQSYVESGNDDVDLVSLVANEAGFLNATERELLDRIFGYAPLDELVQDEIDAFDQLKANSASPALKGEKRDGCINASPDISTAQQLSDAMLMGALGDAATNPDGPAGRTLAALGVTLSAGGVIPGYGTAFSVAGAGLAVWQASGEYLGGVYPSNLTNLEFAIDRTEFPEDETGFAQWSNVMVTATSDGWTADASLANTAISALGLYLGAAQKLAIAGNHFLRDVTVTGVNMALGEFLGTQDGGIVEFCADQWVIDITDLPYSTAQVLDRKFDVDTATRQVRPTEVGADVLRVAAQASEFAGRTVQTDVALNTRVIIVSATPEDIFVQTLGEVVNIAATIQNAETETLLWTAQQGSWQDGIGDDTNGPMTRPLKTPTSEGAYPFLVTVESTSQGGLRASGEPPRLDIVTVRYQAGEVIVTAEKECVPNSQTGTFSATVVGIDDQSVVWTLEDPDTGLPSTAGNINSAGVYSAPTSGSGTVMVVATSAVNSNIRGQVIISYGGCICYYDLTITGEGNWVGDFVTHDFGQFAPLFMMTLGDLANSEEGSGMVQGFPGPSEGATGTFDAGLTFIEGVTGWGTDEGTDGWATLTITENTTSVLVGSMTGTVVAVRGEEEVRRSFTLQFRSAQVNLGETPCQGR